MQCLVRFEHRIGINVGMHLQVNIVKVQQVAKFVGDVN